MKTIYIDRARHENNVKKLNPEPYEVDLIDMRRPNLWMQQVDRSGNEYTEMGQILKAFGCLLALIAVGYLVMWIMANSNLPL